MRYVAAYLLAVLGGKECPCESDLKAIIESVGVGFDEERACLICKNLHGKKIDELIELGKSKMASMPSGGASAGGSAAPAGGDAGGAEEKKEEKKKEESEEESDDDMGFGLFD